MHAQFERLEVQRTPTRIDIILRGSHTPYIDELRQLGTLPPVAPFGKEGGKNTFDTGHKNINR